MIVLKVFEKIVQNFLEHLKEINQRRNILEQKLYDANNDFTYLKKYPNLKRFYGDGYEGLPTFAPFDKIIITAAAPEIPKKLIQQLKTGGMMVIPEGTGEVQTMKRITKTADGLREEIFDHFSFVPMLQGKKE